MLAAAPVVVGVLIGRRRAVGNLGARVALQGRQAEPLAGRRGEVALGRSLEDAAVELLGLLGPALLPPHLAEGVERARGHRGVGVFVQDAAVPVGRGVGLGEAEEEDVAELVAEAGALGEEDGPALGGARDVGPVERGRPAGAPALREPPLRPDDVLLVVDDGPANGRPPPPAGDERPVAPDGLEGDEGVLEAGHVAVAEEAGVGPAGGGRGAAAVLFEAAGRHGRAALEALAGAEGGEPSLLLLPGAEARGLDLGPARLVGLVAEGP